MIKRWGIRIFLFLILIYLIVDLFYYQNKSTHIYNDVFHPQSSSKNPYYIFVDLDDYKMYIFKDGKVIKTYPVAGGKYSTPSPLGTWKIVSKSNWGEGFGGSWMGFNVPWGKYGIHGTDEPWSIGAPMSHGCIRMNNKDAKEVRLMIPHGTKVTIIKGPYGPFGDGFRSLKPGARGSDVMAIQKKMKELGYYYGWPDGIYGEGMKAAIHKFQKDHKLPVSNTISLKMCELMGFFPFE